MTTRRMVNYKHLLGVWHYAKYLACFILFFNPHSNPVRWTLLTCLFHNGSEMLGHVLHIEVLSVQDSKLPE